MGTHLKIVGWFMTSTRSRLTRNSHNVLTQHILPHLLCTGLTGPRSPQVLLPDYARVGNDAKRVQMRCAQWMMRVVFSAIRLGPKTSECEMHVSVKSTVTGCDVTYCCNNITRVQQARSSRRAAVSDSRGVSRCTENFQKSTLAHMWSIIQLIQSTIPVSSDSHGHSLPLYHLTGELVLLSSVPKPSIDLNLWNRSRPSAFVPISLGFTSVLTDEHR